MKYDHGKKELLNYLKEIHQSSQTPFIIFNTSRVVIFANRAFLNKFNFSSESSATGKEINFLFSKEEKQITTFSSMPINNILKSTNIFSYFPRGKDETFFYITTFKAGEENKESFYYSILKEISDLEEKLMEESIRALVIASQLKDNDTGNHVKRVNAYSYIISKHLYENHNGVYPEIDLDFIEKIFKVASMHDVGKIGTPDYILTKQGKLTENEFQIMKEHTINGAFILSKMAGQMARDIALFHHEKWDGSGYPYQLKENQIPISARIVALSDVYDALRMKRHYKPTYTHKKAKDIILKEKGKLFDPVLVNSFIEIENRFEEIFDKMRDEDSIKSYHTDLER